MTSLFYAFRDSPQRRQALDAAPGAGERYVLYGFDELRDRGFAIRHNLESAGTSSWARITGRATKTTLEHAGGYGGEFATVLDSLGVANRADVVVSTVDTVGIPLLLAKRAGLMRRPLVYVAIGLPERLALLRGDRMRRLYARALSATAAVVTYSEHEADELRRWIAAHGHGARIEFVPFGVDAEVFVPPTTEPTEDVVSVGVDPHRDFELLLRVAETLPNRSFRLVVSGEHARSIRTTRTNVTVEQDLRFDEMRGRLERARVVALPVRENSYSGATTVLLQAMALAKPVVVTRTRAIATGYELVDGGNCRLVPPGDEQRFAHALARILGDDLHATALGASARSTVERALTWQLYVDRIEGFIRRAARCARSGVGTDID